MSGPKIQKKNLFESDSDEDTAATTSVADPKIAQQQQQQQQKGTAGIADKKSKNGAGATTFSSASSKAGVAAAPTQGEALRINQKYAAQYDEIKRKKELQRLTDKFGKDVGAEDDDEESSEEEEVGEEDRDAALLTAKKEKLFAEVFASLRRNDPRIRDAKVPFFKAIKEDDDGEGESDEVDADEEHDDDDDEVGAKKKFTLRDEYKRTVLGGEAAIAAAEEGIDEDHRRSRLAPKTDAERRARAEFLKAAAAGDDIGDFAVKQAAPVAGKKGNKSEEKSSRRRAADNDDDDDEEDGESSGDWKQTLAAAFGDAPNEDERFLKDFFVNERWRDDKAAGGDGDDDEELNWQQIAADEQDDAFFEDQEQWERDFQSRQFRHEDGAAALEIQTFPRQQEGLLRKKDSARAAARERKEEREKEKALRMTDELKRLKALKRRDIEEKRRAIEQVAGLSEEAALKKLSREDLEGDFDPAAFDKMMAKLFDDNYYDAIDDDELRRMEDEDMLGGAAEEGEEEDDESDESDEEPKKTKAAAAAATKKGGAAAADVEAPALPGGDDIDFLYPSHELTNATTHADLIVAAKSGGKGSGGSGRVASLAGKSKEELQAELDAHIEEYWKLHYHKVAGGVRTRFKYREVAPESFTLSDAEVLTTDDRTLNMIAPLSGYAAYLTSKENLVDRYKAIHRRKNVRQLDPTRKSRRYGELSKTVILSEDLPEEDKLRIAENIAKTKEALGGEPVSVRDPEATVPAAPTRGGSGGGPIAGAAAAPNARPSHGQHHHHAHSKGHQRPPGPVAGHHNQHQQRRQHEQVPRGASSIKRPSATNVNAADALQQKRKRRE